MGPVSGKTIALLKAWTAVATAGFCAAQPLPAEWSPQVAEALHFYRKGQLAAAQELSQQLAAESRDAQVRREAAAIRAMCLLNGPSRADWSAGLAELARLEQEAPELARRAECLLAAGRAHAALYQTAAALRSLDEAARKFTVYGEFDRARAALVSLAEAWSVHNEWDVPLPQFAVQRPQSPQAARQVRAEQIARVRERLAKLPNAADDLARVDLILARMLLSVSESAPDGRRLLEKLAGSASLTPAVQAAALLLAELYEQEGRLQEAQALYRRLVDQAVGTAAEEAARRLSQLVGPQLVLEVPDRVLTGETMTAHLRARNLQAVELEVRRVDLPAFLAARRGVWSEAALSVTGSVVFSRRLKTQTAQEHQWWSSDGLAGPLEFRAGPGAYVVRASAADGQQPGLEVRRLVIVSDLAAYVCVGPKRVLACVGPAVPDVPTLDWRQAEVSFWMSGSFVPVRARCTDGVACFAVPPEAKVLRDKRWTLLAQVDGHLALCRGQLPRPEELEPAAVALTYAPAAVRAGRSLALAGLLLEPTCSPDSRPNPLELELCDNLGKLLVRQAVMPLSGGVFVTRLNVPDAWAGQGIRASVSREKKTLPIIDGRLSFRVEPSGGVEAVVASDLPSHVTPKAAEISGRIAAYYPWGAALRTLRVHAVVRGLALPSEENGWSPRPFGPYILEKHDADDAPEMIKAEGLGRYRLRLPLSSFELPPGPAALGLWAFMSDTTGRDLPVMLATLVSPQSVHTWLYVQPQPARVGDGIRSTLGWFDSDKSMALARPVLRLRGERVDEELTLRPVPQGLQSEPWVAADPGRYEISASLLRHDGSSMTVARTFEVLAPSGPAPPICQAYVSTVPDRGGIQVRTRGSLEGPVAFVARDSDPRGAVVLPRLEGQTELFIPTDAACRGLALELVSLAGEGRTVTKIPVEEDAAHRMILELSKSSQPLVPGQSVRINAVCRRGDVAVSDAVLLARLANEMGAGPVHWMPENPTEASETLPGAGSPTEAAIAAHAHLPDAVRRTMIGGASEWLAVQSPGVLEVPLPPAPGLYRLAVLAGSPTGSLADASVLLDTRGGLEAWVDVPAQSTVGDRFAVTVGLRKPAGPPVAVELTLDVGAALTIVPSPPASPVVLPEVSASSFAWFAARVEATTPGRGVAAARLTFNGLTQVVSAPYEVLAADEVPAATAGLALRRSVFVLAQLPPGESQETGDSDRRGAVPLSSGDCVLTGQELLIREVFTLKQPLADVLWSQRLPPNCLTAFGPARGSAQVGELKERWAGVLRFSASWLEPGAYVHEYVVVASRPGVCVLPAPKISTETRPIAVKVEPADLRVNVLDTESGG